MATILIVDDEKNIREHLALYVRSLRHRAEVAPDATEALALLERHDPDVIFSDVRMAGMDGLALLREIRRRRPDAVVVLMTAYARVAGAVEAMRAGAYDYLVKPFSLDQVGLLLTRVLEVQALRRENRALRRVLDEPAVLESASPTMARALATARQAAASDATLLLTGESGTGKNVLAAAMHAPAATNRHRGGDAPGARFGEAPYSRRNVTAIRLPPLRERAADLPALTDHVLASVSARHRRGQLVLAPEARRALAAYAWPGNVRELVNTLERAVVLSRGDTIRAEDLPDRLLEPPPAAPATPEAGLSLEDVERRHIVQGLAESSTLEDAAARLGINVTTLWRKRRRYGIE